LFFCSMKSAFLGFLTRFCCSLFIVHLFIYSFIHCCCIYIVLPTLPHYHHRSPPFKNILGCN
jgi:hypothetical protein